MIRSVIKCSIVITLIVLHPSHAGEVKSITEQLYSNSFEEYNRFDKSLNAGTQSCDVDNTAFITVYSITGKAQQGIDVMLDGSAIGNLTTYFPDDMPECKTPSTKGIITIVVPAGKHTLEASSPNLTWPSHRFTVEKCECIVLPLS